MKSRNIIALLFLVMAVIFFVVKGRLWESHKKEAFNRHPSQLVYTHHALCRMDCRHISREDIDMIMQNGVIIFNKSDLLDRPCPTYALQGFAKNNENLRVIFAQCDSVTKVVTCYDLHRDYECNCPGDESKSKNRN